MKGMMNSSPTHRPQSLVPLGLGACVGAALVAAAPAARAQAESGNTVRMERLEKENQELKQRLDTLETLAKKEGLLGPSGPANYVKALSGVQLSGFVTASYFYDTSKPGDRKSNAYLWNTSE